MVMPLWLSAAWGWLKRNWKWLLLPVGVLLWLLGRATSKKTVVVESSAIEKHDEVSRQIEAQAAAQREAADSKLEGQLAGISAAHSAEVTAATNTVIKEAQEVEGNSEGVNDLLKHVSKDMRK